MKKIQITFAVLSFLVFSLSINAQVEKETIITNTESLFGKLIHKERNLFEVNKDFNLQLKFQNNELIEFLVMRKKQFIAKTVPTESIKKKKGVSFADLLKVDKEVGFLNENEFEDILSKLNSIKPTGKLIYGTEDSRWNYERTVGFNFHESAEVIFHRNIDKSDQLKDRCVIDIVIYFPETITGEVISKEQYNIFEDFYEIGIKTINESNHDWHSLYRVTKETYDTLILNKSQTFKGIKAGGTPLYNSEKN